jgi:hypothetical protein
VYVTAADAPYPSSELATVNFLLFDATGALVTTGQCTMVEEGHYQVVLSADVTNGMEAGSNRLEVAVASNVVSIPSFAAYEFVTAAP